jgi:hypothetical protein
VAVGAGGAGSSGWAQDAASKRQQANKMYFIKGFLFIFYTSYILYKTATKKQWET